MKKMMILSAAVMTLAAFPAMAEDAVDDAPPPPPEKGQMFDKHDTNGDGVISKDEFLGHAEERFSKIDTDGDGSVSKEEAKAGHEKMRKKIRKHMKERRGEHAPKPE